MSLAVRVEQTNGTYTAHVLGDPVLRAEAETREAALSSLKTKIDKARQAGVLVLLPDEPVGVTDLIGLWKDDPLVDDIVAEIYRQRDAERPTE